MNAQTETATLTSTDWHTVAVALQWIRRHRELHHQPPSPSIERALASVLAVNRQAAQPNPREWLTTTEVAQRIGCSKRQAQRIAARHGTRIGRQWLTPAEHLEE